MMLLHSRSHRHLSSSPNRIPCRARLLLPTEPPRARRRRGGDIGDENGSSSSVDPLVNPLDVTLLEDAAMSSNTPGDEFVFFDLDRSTFDRKFFSL